jgi:hypothetical protein
MSGIINVVVINDWSIGSFKGEHHRVNTSMKVNQWPLAMAIVCSRAFLQTEFAALKHSPTSYDQPLNRNLPLEAQAKENENADTSEFSESELLPPILGYKESTILELLVQRAIQITTCDESLDQPQNNVIMGKEHQHLHGNCCWHGILGMRFTFDEYFHYLFRQPDSQALVNEKRSDSKKDPREALLANINQLSLDWKADLQELSQYDSVAERKARDAQENHLIDLIKHGQELPSFSEMAEWNPVRRMHKRGGAFAVSPRRVITTLRAENLELLLRWTTLNAIALYEVELATNSLNLAVWFEPIAEEWREKLEVVEVASAEQAEQRNGDEDPTFPRCIALELIDALSAMPSDTFRGTVTNPKHMAKRLLDYREKAALRLAAQIQKAPALIAAVKRRESLESAFLL